MSTPLRLHWGCGPITPFGWINTDVAAFPGVEPVADIRQGLPFDDNSFDCCVSIHALPELSYAELRPALTELRRVLKPGGVLRLGLPDMDKAIDAYRGRDPDYFLIEDDVVRSLSGKMIVQLTWFGRSRSMYTTEFISELLLQVGFRQVLPCDYQQTTTGDRALVQLDNRPLESLFVEAIK